MGHLQATEAARLMDLDTALRWHLSYNHYPPIPECMVGPCKRAIENAKQGHWNKQVRMPKGVSYRGRSFAPTNAIVEQHHLDAFIE